MVELEVGPQGVLTKHEDAKNVIWVLNIQTTRLIITLQQLKLKVVEVT